MSSSTPVKSRAEHTWAMMHQPYLRRQMVRGTLFNVGASLSGENTADVVVSFLLRGETQADVAELVSNIGVEYAIVEAPAIPE